MDPENETPADETVVETPAAETSAAETPAPAEAADQAPKSALEALSEGIENGQKPKRIESKSTEEQGDTRPRNPDGTFKTETPEEKAAREAAETAANETPEEKAAREAAEAEAAKKADPINDPIPDGLNKRTSERMKHLIDTVKAQEALVEQHNSLFGAITDTGASPDEFAAMLSYMKSVHSNDPKTLESAYTMLQSELRGLSVKLGKPLYEVNLLREPANQDLVAEVQAGQLNVDRAHEIALQREIQRRNQTQAKSQDDTRASAEEAARLSAAGKEDLNKLDGELRARDGDEIFAAKYAVLVPMLKNVFTRLDPREWRGVFLEQYNNLNLPPPVAAAAAPAERTMPQRPKAPAGAGNAAPAPKSALEALNAALG